MNFESYPETRDIYKFNEVTSVTGVKPYVLRFWESEFEQIAPALSEGGHKIYSNEDVAYIQKIKKLLFEDKLSIPQAKAVFDTEAKTLLENQLKQRAHDLEKQNPEIAPVNMQSSGITAHNSTLDMVKNALASELEAKSNPTVVNTVKSFNDTDVVNLVQAKKKLSIVLSKINQTIADRAW